MSQHDRAPYSVRHERVDGRALPIFSITCGKCGTETIDTSMNPAAPQTAIIQKLRNKAHGWHVSPNRARYHRCSTCNTPPRGLTPISPAPEGTAMPTAHKAAAPAADPTTSAPAHIVDGKPIPVLTPEQKKRVRDLLDGVFDEAKGMYLDGHSDKVVGEKLNLPWAGVAHVREAAYGPIRVDPEIQRLLDGIAVAEKLVAAAAIAANTATNAVTDARRELDLMRQRVQAHMKGDRV